MTGIPSDLVRTPSGSGKTTWSSAAFDKFDGVIVEANETDEIELGIRPATPLFSVVDDDDETSMIDVSKGSV